MTADELLRPPGYTSPGFMEDVAAERSRRNPAEVLRERLAYYVGPFTARTAIQTFAKEALGIHPDAVTLAQVPTLLEALGPVLRTLLGKGADEVLNRLRQELHP